MAGDDADGSGGPLEERLRRRLRFVAGVTLLVLIVVLALADTFGRGADLHASEFIFGSILGGFLLIIGVEGASRFLGNGRK